MNYKRIRNYIALVFKANRKTTGIFCILFDHISRNLGALIFAFINPLLYSIQFENSSKLYSITFQNELEGNKHVQHSTRTYFSKYECINFHSQPFLYANWF